MATKKQEKKQRILTIILAVMVTFSLAGLGSGFFGTSGSGDNTQQGDGTTNTSDIAKKDYGRVVCSTGNNFHIHAQLSIRVDGQEQAIPSGIGVAGSCTLEINTEDNTGKIHIESVLDRGYTWNDFFVVLGVDPLSIPGFILEKIVVDGVDTPVEKFDFNTKIKDGQDMVLEYLSLPSPS